jgi:hypothetical protein
MDPSVSVPDSRSGGSPVSSLREAARLLAIGEPLPEPLAIWLAGSFHAFLNRQGGDLEDALGLRWGRGGVPWWMDEAIRARDAALRHLADILVPTGSGSARARAVHLRTMRYAGTAWPRDRQLAEMPGAYLGQEREFLWRAFASGAAMPLGERRLRQIFACECAAG